MAEQKPASDLSKTQNAGIVVFIVTCGLPALEINGFGFGLPISLELALVIASLGGAVGGVLFCPRPLIAGLAGGLLAGPGGLLGVYFYTMARTTVWTVELALVQAAASVPGVLLGIALKRLLAPAAPAVEQAASPGGTDPDQPAGQA